MTEMLTYKKPVVIAEIGCNHKGEMEVAHELIQNAASFCHADIVKFQKRNPSELLSKEEYQAPHPNPHNSYGSTYGEHREFLELSLDQHKTLKEWCEAEGLIYSTSVWDMTSAKEITSLNPKMIKIPSACNLNFEMLAYLCDAFEGELHVALGMTTHAEEEQIMSFFEQKKRLNDVIMYACTSGYPVPFEDTCLLEIKRLKECYAHRVKDIGFSGHHLGIAIDIAAYTLGASYIERHYTMDRTWKGTDHAASLEPMGVRKLVRDLANTHKALSYKSKEILAIEAVQRKKLKREKAAL